jgi:hypothetical protein
LTQENGSASPEALPIFVVVHGLLKRPFGGIEMKRLFLLAPLLVMAIGCAVPVKKETDALGKICNAANLFQLYERNQLHKMVFLPNLCVIRRACLCGVAHHTSAQTLDFLDLGQKSSFLDWKHHQVPNS